MKIGCIIHNSLRRQLFSDCDMERLLGLADVLVADAERPMSVQEACAALADREIAIGSWSSPYPCAEILAACKGLRLWEHAAGTVKHFFGPHLHGSGLMIASCKTAIAADVAELAVAEIVIGLRQIIPNALQNRSVAAPKPEKMRVLSHSVVGVIGASEVGKQVIKRLRQAGCRVMLYDPYVSTARAAELEVTLFTDLTDMCGLCDAVTLHTPNVPACRHLVGAEQLAAMQSDTVFVNTSRGDCVDEAALVAELQRGRLFAFLDVSSPEPAALESPLRSLPNVVYTSHIAGPPSFNIGRQAVDDIAAFMRGESPLCVVTEDQLEFTA